MAKKRNWTRKIEPNQIHLFGVSCRVRDGKLRGFITDTVFDSESEFKAYKERVERMFNASEFVYHSKVDDGNVRYSARVDGKLVQGYIYAYRGENAIFKHRENGKDYFVEVGKKELVEVG